MKIEKIKRLPSGKYKIEFDNNEKFVTYDDVLIKNSVLYKDNVTNDTLREMTIDTAYYDVYNKVLNYISKRIRSIKEINTYLNKFNIEEKERFKIIESLKSSGLLNDEKFAKAYIYDKIYLSQFGPNRIKNELLSHDIDELVIDELISEIDETIIKDNLTNLIKKKINHNHKQSNFALKQKLFYEFSNNGYDKEMINNVLNKLCNNESSILQNEYLKLYSKLSKKYNDKELYNKIKEKLYAKGFDIDSINNVLRGE